MIGDYAILHIGDLMVTVAVGGAAIAVIVFALAVCAPQLWRAAREWL